MSQIIVLGGYQQRLEKCRNEMLFEYMFDSENLNFNHLNM